MGKADDIKKAIVFVRGRGHRLHRAASRAISHLLTVGSEGMSDQSDSREIEIVEVPCPGCGDRPPDLVTDDLIDVEDRVFGTYAIGKCRRCSLVYLSFRPTVESLPRCYPVDYHVHDSGRQGLVPSILYGMRARLRQRRVFAAAKGQVRSLLEVGCGDAAFLLHLDSVCPPSMSLVGIDLQAPRINRGRLQVSSGDFGAEDLVGTFDAVVMFNVLEHLPDPITSLGKIRKHMPSGGVIYGEVPDWRSTWRHVFPKHWQGLQIPRHMSFFEPDTLRDSLERAGFGQVHIRELFDPGDLGVTMCNWITDRFGLKTHPRQAWFFLPIVLLTTPIAWLSFLVTGRAGSLEFTAKACS